MFFYTVVGTAALPDDCACLRSCIAKQAYLPSQTSVKNSESAYADLGAGDNIAGMMISISFCIQMVRQLYINRHVAIVDPRYGMIFRISMFLKRNRVIKIGCILNLLSPVFKGKSYFVIYHPTFIKL